MGACASGGCPVAEFLCGIPAWGWWAGAAGLFALWLCRQAWKREHFFASLFYWTARAVCFAYFRCKFRLRITGAENIPVRGGAVLCANHTSYLDPPVLGCATSRRLVRFMARSTLAKNKWLDFLYKRLKAILLDRDRGDLGAMKTAIKCLKAGDVVGIFPEGTRSPDGTIQEAKGGIAFLLAKAAVPVVPMHIAGAYQAFPKGAKKFSPSRITVTIGKPIPPEEILAAMPQKGDYAAAGALVMRRIAGLAPEKTP
ncbi:MAG: 1-acyl-sn-glycerol-3-phosphate acyltransferase [Kiritimatiellae bacterium]|nr:1-acyl-sn-glycerol-3-phosphate acyltransferase [Kiritimatiellia bacterium]